MTNSLKRRSAVALERDVEVETACSSLIEQDEEITARAVSRMIGVAPSSITRDQIRMQILEKAQERLSHLRAWRTRQAKQSRERDAENLVDKDIRIAELERSVELLIASHKAMVLAIGELGGIAAWQRFFPVWQEVGKELQKLGAMPISQPTEMTKKKEQD